MNVISRIQFPRTPETSGLYMKCNEDASLNFCGENAEVALTKNGVLSLNTYFNSFYEKFYAKYTELSYLYYLLKLEGDFQVSLYRECSDRENRELIHTQRFENCQLSEPVKILLPDSWRSEEAGRIYLEITCLSESGLFTGGFIATEQPKIREVFLGIITCTFKKEAYVKNTVSDILKDDFLQDKNLKVFVVDNGRTLKQDEFDNARVKLISNRNVGGSGGFTRGLIEALEEDVHTHFLFMDDDIELESESIYRLFPLYEYAQQDFAVAGAMLDLYKKHILYEAGALYSKEFDHEGNLQSYQFISLPLKHNLDLLNPTLLNSLLLEDDIDYGGFWFFCFSKKVVENIGLPLPFFIKIDDMEFGLRIKEHLGNQIVAFPSLAVWHEPFYAKKPVWDIYYSCRNYLITDSIYSSSEYFSTVKNLTRGIVYHLLIFDYNSAQMTFKAFEDYMQGPNLIKLNDPEIWHHKISEFSKTHKTKTIQANSIPNNGYQTTKAGKVQKLVSLLTLNGHLLPNFFISNESAFIRYGSQEKDTICKAFTKKRVVYALEENPNYYEYELDHQTGLNILFSWVKFAIISSRRWTSVSTEWKKAANDLTSIQFWQDYLEPQKYNQVLKSTEQQATGHSMK